MIVDSHCHAWARWPYQPPVADERTRGSAATLLSELAARGVDHALVVAARIGENPDNNAYVAQAVSAAGHRLSMVVDVDSHWSADYHTPGASSRLEREAKASGAAGFTHYLAAEDDGWLDDPEGDAFFARAEQLGLIASLHAPPAWHDAVLRIAQRHPGLVVLLHHQGLVRSEAEVERLVRLARAPGIGLKVSGFTYLTDAPHPFPDAVARLAVLARAFGPDRLAWGSDFPVCTRTGSYQQALDIVHDHLAFLDDAERQQVLGGTMARLLGLGIAA